MEQARKSGVKVGSLKLVTVWPFPEKRIAELAKKVKAFVVSEMNFGQIVFEVQRCSYGKANVFFMSHGEKGVEYTDDIVSAIKQATQMNEVKSGIIELGV
jgi:2-oxoglutarate ferredoxin oxidoreductase subunit alpha